MFYLAMFYFSNLYIDCSAEHIMTQLGKAEQLSPFE